MAPSAQDPLMTLTRGHKKWSISSPEGSQGPCRDDANKHKFSILCCISGGSRRQDRMIDPTVATFPAILLWYGLKKSTERHHRRQSSWGCPPERKGRLSGPLISLTPSAVSISSTTSLHTCSFDCWRAASTPGLDSRHPMKLWKSCITNGCLGTSIPFLHGVDPSLSKSHPPWAWHGLLIHSYGYVGNLSLSFGGYKELHAGQHV